MDRKRYFDRTYKVIFLVGICLACSEIVKQILLFFCVYNRAYRWWYFPFQLCSIPMYLCILLPFAKKKRAVLCFLMDINLLSGIFAFCDISGMIYPLPVLTLHSVCWHVTMIFLGIYTGVKYSSGLKWKDYLGAVKIFAITAALAEGVNILVSKYVTADINMFYINPYVKFTQVVFRDLGKWFPDGVVIGTYLLAVLLGGFLFHAVWMLMKKF